MAVIPQDNQTSNQSGLGLNKPGTGLIEALLALTLMGVVLIPLMFLSSTWFNNQLLSSRQNLQLTHNATYFMNQLITELSNTQTILPTSDSTHLYFVYYDPMQETTVKRGYQLTTPAVGGFQYLEKLNYNDSTSTWTNVSPYATADSIDLLLPTSTQFQYCIGANCALSSPSNAMIFKVSNWTFTLSNTPKSISIGNLTLPIGSRLRSNTRLGLEATQLFAFATSNFNSVSSAKDDGSFFLGADGRSLFELSNTTGYADTAVGLTTIASSTDSSSIGQNATAVRNDGRVFFGSGSGKKMYTWASSTGLSTIYNGENGDGPGESSSLLISPNNMAVFMDKTGYIHTWDESNGRKDYVGLGEVMTSPRQALMDSAGWAYFAGFNSGRLYALNTTLAIPTTQGDAAGQFSSGYNNAGAGGIGMASDASDGGDSVYFITRKDSGTSAYNKVFRWRVRGNNALSTLETNNINAISSNLVYNNGYLYYGLASAGMRIYNTGSGLSTLVNTGDTPTYILNDNSGWVYMMSATYVYGVKEDGSGAVYKIGGAGGPFTSPMLAGDGNGRVYFADATKLYAWNGAVVAPNANASTLYTGAPKGKLYVDPYSGNLLFNNSNKFYTYNPTSGVSTLLANSGTPMAYFFSDTSGRVFFADTTKLMTWKSGEGAYTIRSSANIGINNAIGATYDPVAGVSRIFYGINATSPFYSWTDPIVRTVYRLSSTGNPTNSPIRMKAPAYTSYRVQQDVNGDLYAANRNKPVFERWRYNRINGYYSLVGTLEDVTTGTYFSLPPNDIALDKSGTALYALITSTKHVYKIEDRTCTGLLKNCSVTPATLYDLNTLSTVPANPTSIAVNSRTGDLIILDASQPGGVAYTAAKLYVAYTTPGTNTIALKASYNLNLANLTPTTATYNYLIRYNDRDNILYLMDTTASQVYAISLPAVLQ
ncbi:MAG: hypothetical protein K2X01_05300 [Cyanobacteria bacterium]|nr:hypothetical protein [Cyanobacteriota bacterium]